MTPEEARRKRFRARRFHGGLRPDEVYGFLGDAAAAIEAALAEARAARSERDRLATALREWQSLFTPNPTALQPPPVALPRHAAPKDINDLPAWSAATASYPATGRYRSQNHD